MTTSSPTAFSQSSSSSSSSSDDDDWSVIVLTPDEWKNKYDAILECLRAPQVNLWRLRQLALTKGGLLCPQLRKRAWPCLLQCPQQVVASESMPQDEGGGGGRVLVESPDAIDIDLLHEDLAETTIWDVQRHLLRSKQRQFELEQELRANQRRVRFAVPLVEKHVVPSSRALEENWDSEWEKLPHNLPTLPENESTRSEEEDDDDEEEEDSSSSSKEHLRHSITSHHASTEEQKVLWNAIYSLLCRKEHHYIRGLHNLTALLMINLESPSITSIALQQLATAHLQQALRDETAWRRGFKASFQSLLKQLDQTSVSRPPSPTWWWKDVTDVRVASRLLDVVLVSHPVMPVYLAAAAAAAVSGESSLEPRVETVITRAVECMKQVPPPKSHTIPAWCTQSYAESDWAILRRARRTPSVVLEDGWDDNNNNKDHNARRDYPLAQIALGLQPLAPKEQPNKNKRGFFFSLLLLLLWGMIVVAMLVLATVTTHPPTVVVETTLERDHSQRIVPRRAITPPPLHKRWMRSYASSVDEETVEQQPTAALEGSRHGDRNKSSSFENTTTTTIFFVGGSLRRRIAKFVQFLRRPWNWLQRLMFVGRAREE